MMVTDYSKELIGTSHWRYIRGAV